MMIYHTCTLIASGGNNLSMQIASCDETGSLMIWTVLDDQKEADVDLGLAHWGRVRMVATEIVDLRQEEFFL